MVALGGVDRHRQCAVQRSRGARARAPAGRRGRPGLTNSEAALSRPIDAVNPFVTEVAGHRPSTFWSALQQARWRSC